MTHHLADEPGSPNEPGGPDEPMDATAASTAAAAMPEGQGAEPVEPRIDADAAGLATGVEAAEGLAEDAAEPRLEPEAAPDPGWTHEPATSAPDPAADPGVDPDLRIAHLLLRMGSPLPARAHLETLAGANRLDRQGLLDLAESRWRTGDLRGAGEATVAYFEHGGVAALAYLIAAEATAATGRPSEAGRFARRALDGLTLPLDAVFAGQPRGPIWPNDPADPGLQVGTLFAEPANEAARGGRIGLTSASRAAVEAPLGPARAALGGVGVMAEPLPSSDRSNQSREGRPDRSLWDEPDRADEPGTTAPAAQAASAPDQAPIDAASRGLPDDPSAARPSVDRDGLDPALPDVGAELDAARDDLDAGDNRAAAVRLAVVLRLRPALAPAVLDMIGDLPGPDFDLLRGDALRLVGHEAAAQRAFASAANALPEPSDARSSE